MPWTPGYSDSRRVLSLTLYRDDTLRARNVFPPRRALCGRLRLVCGRQTLLVSQVLLWRRRWLVSAPQTHGLVGGISYAPGSAACVRLRVV